jgi:hypothetical protein
VLKIKLALAGTTANNIAVSASIAPAAKSEFLTIITLTPDATSEIDHAAAAVSTRRTLSISFI